MARSTASLSGPASIRPGRNIIFLSRAGYRNQADRIVSRHKGLPHVAPYSVVGYLACVARPSNDRFSLPYGVVGIEAVNFARKGRAMRDYQGSLEKLRRDAAESRLIADLATDKTKREMFDKLAKHLAGLADEVERAMKSGEISN
jgi:hypothetical protein